ncbi:MAG: hypothetical protein K2Y37_09245 [Pirellulales bacterium]|nr:hypothetical protein [Pirellulales bacterium]
MRAEVGSSSQVAEARRASDERRDAWLASLRGVGPWGAWLVVFLALVALRWEIVATPPYHDCATAVFMEANYLADSRFDYLALREQPYFNEGGPYCYMISIVPTLVAAGMLALPSPVWLFVVYHLIVLACGAAALVLVYALLPAAAGATVRTLTALAVLATPVFSVQVDMLGLDLPLATCALGVAWLLVKRRFRTAVLLAVLAFFIKATGLIVVVATLLALVAWLAANWNVASSAERRRAMTATIMAALSVAACYALYDWSGYSAKILKTPMLSRFLPEFLLGSPTLALDAVLLLLLVTIGLCRVAISSVRGGSLGALVAAPWRSCQSLLQRHEVALFSGLVYAGTLAAIAWYVHDRCPRYYTLSIPFAFLIAGDLLLREPARRRLAIGILAFILTVDTAYNFANWQGRDRIHMSGGRNSAEGNFASYRWDHFSVIRAMRAVERQCADVPIVSGHPYAYYLCLPRLGYVEKTLHGYCTCDFTVKAFPDVSGWLVNQEREVALVYVDSVYYRYARITVPRPEDHDPIIYDDRFDSPLIVYRARIPSDVATGTPSRDWLLEKYWFDPTLEQRPAVQLGGRARLLVEAGHLDFAERLLQIGVARQPDQVEFRLDLAICQAMAGKLADASQTYKDLLSRQADNWEANQSLGLLELRQGHSAEAIPRLQAALAHIPPDAGNPQHVAAALHQQLAVAFQQLGRFDEAKGHWLEAQRLDPRIAARR